MEALLAAVGGTAAGGLFTFALLRIWENHSPLNTQAQAVRYEIAQVRDSVIRLSDRVQHTGGDDRARFAELSTVLRNVDDRTTALAGALTNSRVRGRWGERAAEDILRAAGFVEGASYFKQQAQAGDGTGPVTRPDFVFPLPKGYRVNMDVKFPIENYVRALESESPIDQEAHQHAFIRDVRDRVKEVHAYADPANGTVDYALLFIPSEGVYSEINRLVPGLIDDALAQRVILCSPLTLFGVLAVIRRAVDSFALRQASGEVLRLMAAFDKEWGKFTESLAVLGRQIATVRGTYDDLSGRRKRALQAPLDAIDALRTERGIDPLSAPLVIEPTAIERDEAHHGDGVSGTIERVIAGQDASKQHRHKPNPPVADELSPAGLRAERERRAHEASPPREQEPDAQ
jgi:DNA recombination protein RmuC